MEQDVLPWLKQAILDFSTACYRPCTHYVQVFEGAAREIDKLREQVARYKEADKAIHDSYLRIRKKLKDFGSYDTLPGGSDRFERTEEAIDRVFAAKARLDEANPMTRHGEGSGCTCIFCKE